VSSGSWICKLDRVRVWDVRRWRTRRQNGCFGGRPRMECVLSYFWSYLCKSAKYTIAMLTRIASVVVQSLLKFLFNRMSDLSTPEVLSIAAPALPCVDSTVSCDLHSTQFNLHARILNTTALAQDFELYYIYPRIASSFK
jgi:hypothetical protein